MMILLVNYERGVSVTIYRRLLALKKWLVIFLKGVCMGGADTIPGVSGGTIALIVGIYERLVTAIASLNPFVLTRLLHVTDTQERKRFIQELREMDIGFLVVLGIGIILAIIVVSGITTFALTKYVVETNAFFLGLIGASAIILYKEISIESPRQAVVAGGSILVAFYITGVTAAGNLPHSYPVILLTGSLASIAMLLPGISGAAFMYLLGQYEYLVSALHGFLGALVSGNDLSTAIDPGLTVSIFILGFGIGILTIAHIVRWALTRDRATTMTVLVGLMIGSLRFPAATINDAVQSWTLSTIVITGVVIGVGVFLVLVLDHYTDDLDYSSMTVNR